GEVGLNDLVALANHYGNVTGQTWWDGDFDYNGEVGLNDLVILANQYGSVLGAAADRPAGGFAADWALAQDLAAQGVTSVPEPGGAGVLLIGLGLGLVRRRR
ncbi:MAG: PEP-CTERM sorting domain-containing protein, partial [Phycisphaerae bacterium]